MVKYRKCPDCGRKGVYLDKGVECCGLRIRGPEWRCRYSYFGCNFSATTHAEDPERQRLADANAPLGLKVP